MGKGEVLFDISRLATRFSRRAPNGIDRVDAGYAQHFLDEERGGRGVLLGPLGPRAIDNRAASEVVRAIDRHWREAGRAEDDPAYSRLKAALAGTRSGTRFARESRIDWSRAGASLGGLMTRGAILGGKGLFPGRNLARTAPKGAIYINVSQFPLWVEGYFGWLRRRPDIKAVFFLHDLLPLEYPEFFPCAEEARHSGRLDVLSRHAAGAIVASEHTKAALADQMRSRGREPPPTCVLPLPPATHFLDETRADPELEKHAYFVSIGTIEPRKNQLMLLQIWRELAETLGDMTPKLVLAGVRGWDNENVVDMLERCEGVRRHVIETGGLSTPALRRVLGGARALLMPTFAEGYGLPVVEARAAGVPVVAANLAVFRGLEDPLLTRLDPSDGPGWRDAILGYAGAHKRSFSSPRPNNQAVFPSWKWHLKHAGQFVASL